MNTSSKRPSVSSSSDIEPFDSYQPQVNIPWLCYICGPSPNDNAEIPNMQKKQKVPLSKTTKNIKHPNMKRSINQEQLFGLNIDRNIDQIQSTKITVDLKSTNPTLSRIDDRTSLSNQSSQLAKNRMISSTQTFVNSSFHPQLHVNGQTRYSVGNYAENQVVYQGNPQFYTSTIKNIPNNGSHLLGSNSNIKNTDTSRIKKSMTFSYGSPVEQFQNQQRIADNKLNQKNSFIQFNATQRKITLTPCQSLQMLQLPENDSKSPQNTQSNSSTQQEIPPFTQFRQVVSINDSTELKVRAKKQKPSQLNRTPKFLAALKKESSRSGAESIKKSSGSDRSQLNYTQFGNKIKIGIRKVQSINTDISEDDDQYSQVLSHGQRSFLMPEINEVEQMSRVSSMSGFRNWEDETQR